MCFTCCGSGSFAQDVECKSEEIKDGVQITITAKDPEKAEALKKLYSACKTLSGESCCK
jgi:hypothetical protein